MTTTSARRVARSRRWIEPMARAAHRTSATVHAIVGALAIGFVLGAREASRTSVWAALTSWLVALCLVALAGWHLALGILDPMRTPRARRAILSRGIERAGWLAIALVDAALATAAIQVGRGAPSWVPDALRREPIAGVIVGGLVIVYALAQMRRAWTADLSRDLRVSEMTARQRRRAVRIGRVGVLARGLALAIVGAAIAAVAREPLDAGLVGALEEIAERPSGATLIALVGLGLLAYVPHQLIEARHRRIPSL